MKRPSRDQIHATLSEMRALHKSGHLRSDAAVAVGKWLSFLDTQTALDSAPVADGDRPLAEARNRFWERLQTGEPETCPCCGRTGKIYSRKLNSGMALVLIRLFTLGAHERWVNVKEIFPSVTQRGGEWARMKFWLLVTPRDHRTRDENPRGDWMLTPWGVDFVRGRISVPRHVYLWDNVPQGFSPETTTIQESLGDTFNYAELMSGF